MFNQVRMSTKLTLWYTGVLALALTLFSAGVHALMERKLARRMDANLQAGIEAMSRFFTVADTGAGISVEAQPHVFERFYRADKARERAEGGDNGGAGLGLPIARWIAEAHGGQIYLERSDDRGSTFVITLPVRRQSFGIMRDWKNGFQRRADWRLDCRSCAGKHLGLRSSNTFRQDARSSHNWLQAMEFAVNRSGQSRS